MIKMSFICKDDFFLLIAGPFSETKLKHIHNHIRWADKRIKLIGIFYKPIADPLPSIVQAYTQPYSFGGRLKLITSQIRHELSVTIHEISKKREMADPTAESKGVCEFVCIIDGFSYYWHKDTHCTSVFMVLKNMFSLLFSFFILSPSDVFS